MATASVNHGRWSVVAAAGLAAVAVGIATPWHADAAAGSAGVLDRSGDGRADLVTWDPGTGRWRLGPDRVTLGAAGDIPVPGDWDGDGLVDAATWRPSDGTWEMTGRPPVSVGLRDDVPVPCGWTGPSRLEPAVWRPASGAWLGQGGPIAFLGRAGDVPVPADWSGDGRCDPAVFRPADGSWPGTGHDRPLGQRGDVPVPGAWTEDGAVRRAVWRPSTGEWIVESGTGERVTARLGEPGHEPAPADWSGDGALDPAVWDPRTLTLLGSTGELARGGPHETLLVLPPGIRTVGPDPVVGAQSAAPATGTRAQMSEPERKPPGTGVPVDTVASVAGVTALAAFALGGRRELFGTGSAPASGGAVALARRLALTAAVTLPLGGLALGPLGVADLALVGVIVVLAVHLGPSPAGRRPMQWPAPWLLSAGGALAVLGGVLGAASGPPQSAMALVRAAAGVGVPVLALLLLRPHGLLRRQLATGFCLGSALSAAAASGALLTGMRADGLATHPNHLGLACMLGVATGAHAWRAGLRPRWAGPLVVVNLVGVLMSGSRSALLGLVVLVALGALPVVLGGPAVASRRLARAVAVGAAVVAAAALVHGSTLERLAGDPDSDAGRRFRLEIAADRIGRAPLTGEGFRFVEEAHSVPVQLLVAGGPLTLAGGAMVLAAPVLGSRARSIRDIGWLSAGWLAYLASGLVQNIVVDRYVWFVGALALVSRPRQGSRAEAVPGSAEPGDGVR